MKISIETALAIDTNAVIFIYNVRHSVPIEIDITTTHIDFHLAHIIRSYVFGGKPAFSCRFRVYFSRYDNFASVLTKLRHRRPPPF